MTAQWSDDFHHALHTLLTGEGQGYYADFAADPFEALARTLTGAFFHAGTCRRSAAPTWGRTGRHGRGCPAGGSSATRRPTTRSATARSATGSPSTLSPGLARVAAALVLTSPFTPMLFMGEEWAASTPWQYFTVARGARAGRGGAGGPAARVRRARLGRGGRPRPAGRSTVERVDAGLVRASTASTHAAMLDWYRDADRAAAGEPWLSDPRLDLVSVAYDADARWVVVTRGPLRVVVNLAAGAAGGAGGRGCVVGAAVVVAGVAVGGSAGLELPAESVAVVRLAAS